MLSGAACHAADSRAKAACPTGVRDLQALLFRTGKNIVLDDARRRTAEAHMLQTLAVAGADEVPSAERQVFDFNSKEFA